MHLQPENIQLFIDGMKMQGYFGCTNTSCRSWYITNITSSLLHRNIHSNYTFWLPGIRMQSFASHNKEFPICSITYCIICLCTSEDITYAYPMVNILSVCYMVLYNSYILKLIVCYYNTTICQYICTAPKTSS